MPAPARVEVAAGIILRGAWVLISKRRPDARYGGLWEFPGGTREEGETLEECLVREIKEELDITVRVGRRSHSITESHPDREVTLHFFYCVPVAGTPEALGCQEFRWVPCHELDQFEFPPADRPILDQLKVVRGI